MSAKADAIYARVSGPAQDLRSQLPELKRWAESNGRGVKWFRDTASGKSMDRPGWKKLKIVIGGRPDCPGCLLETRSTRPNRSGTDCPVRGTPRARCRARLTQGRDGHFDPGRATHGPRLGQCGPIRNGASRGTSPSRPTGGQGRGQNLGRIKEGTAVGGYR